MEHLSRHLLGQTVEILTMLQSATILKNVKTEEKNLTYTEDGNDDCKKKEDAA